MIGSAQCSRPFFLLSAKELTSGTSARTAGLGDCTVRAQSQAMTVSPLCWG